MKVITLICESFNRYDIDADELQSPFDKFTLSEFSTHPARCSVSAMYLLQSGGNLTGRIKRLRRMFVPGVSYLGDRIRQRIVSASWPIQCNVRRFDELANMRNRRYGEQARLTVREFLEDEYYQSDIAHLIYWGRVGHVRVRRGRENRGVPRRLRNTWDWCQEWLNKWVMPYVDLDNTLVMLHPDHGSKRRGMPDRQAMYDGFLLSNRPVGATCWAELTVEIEKAALAS